MANPNYVKFQRGSIESYQRLTHKDDNTLYFIYDTDDQLTGKLYLGTRLISSNVGGSSTSLADLSDVIISEVGASNFLISNSEGKWIPVAASEVAQLIVESGGNFISIDENEFTFNSVDGKLEIKGYDAATSGMMPVKSDNGIIWQNAPIDLSTEVETLSGKISTLETNFSTIDGKIANAISNSAHLKYQVITDLSEAKESNIIYLYNNNSNETNNAYDEYMLVNNQLEHIGTYGIDLSDYVTTTDLNTAVTNQITSFTSNLNSRIDELDTKTNNLQTTINNLGDTYVTKEKFNSTVGNLSDLMQYNNLDYSSASITDTFEDIYERLIWQEINE